MGVHTYDGVLCTLFFFRCGRRAFFHNPATIFQAKTSTRRGNWAGENARRSLIRQHQLASFIEIEQSNPCLSVKCRRDPFRYFFPRASFHHFGPKIRSVRSPSSETREENQHTLRDTFGSGTYVAMRSLVRLQYQCSTDRCHPRPDPLYSRLI